MYSDIPKKPVTTADPLFVGFCLLSAMWKQLDLVIAEHPSDESAESINRKHALLTCQSAMGYVLKSLANQIFEPNEPENNG